MIARIEFEQTILSTEQLKKLEYIVGEEINTRRVKRNEDGRLVAISYMDEDNPEVEISGDHVMIGYYGDKHIVDLEELAEQFPNITYKVISVLKKYRYSNVINASVDKLNEALQRFNEKVEFNDRCEVHVANLGLLSINQMMLAEDSCTDELQCRLNEGWRIVSVVPQPDQRRPDYILGRYNPDMAAPNTRAVRG